MKREFKFDYPSAFIDYIRSDKSRYKPASTVINKLTGRAYVDPDGDFLIGDTGGILMNINFTFVNTHLFRNAAITYLKEGRYTLFPQGSSSYEKFRKNEEYKRYYGDIKPCKVNLRGGIEDLRITGEHYNFINYGRIMMIDEDNIKGTADVIEKEESIPLFIDAQYWYFKCREFAKNNSMHMIVGKARRGGFSYMEAVGSANLVNLLPKITVIHGAIDEKYLIEGNAISPMTLTQLNFYEEHTPFNRCGYRKDKKGFTYPAGLLKKAIRELKLGYFTPQGTEAGWLSKVLAVSFFNNPDAAIGKDGKEIKLEEMSTFVNFEEVMAVLEPTTRTGAYTTGFIVAFGTGGSVEGKWVIFERNFYNPDAFNFMPMQNVWDEDKMHTVCGFYKPYWWGLQGIFDGKRALDEFGNSNYDVAIEISKREREIKYSNPKTTDSTFTLYCGQYSNTPSESFSGSTSGMFSSIELTRYIQELESSDDISLYQDGILEINKDKNVVFTSNNILKTTNRDKSIHPYIVDVPLRSGADFHGCVRIYHHPNFYGQENGHNIYYGVVDPVEVSKDKGEMDIRDSLNSFQIWMQPNPVSGVKGDILVAAYRGRMSDVNESDRLFLCMLLYYKCKGLPETNRGSIKSNFNKWGVSHMLYRNPIKLIDNYEKDGDFGEEHVPIGVVIDEKTKSSALIGLKGILYMPITDDASDGFSLFFHNILDLPLLKELNRFGIGNFDTVSALIIWKILRDYVIYERKIVRGDVPIDYNTAINSTTSMVDSLGLL